MVADVGRILSLSGDRGIGNRSGECEIEMSRLDIYPAEETGLAED